jgi:hypothetical protein
LIYCSRYGAVKVDFIIEDLLYNNLIYYMVIFVQDNSTQLSLLSISSSVSSLSVFALKTDLNSLSTNSTLSVKKNTKFDIEAQSFDIICRY